MIKILILPPISKKEKEEAKYYCLKKYDIQLLDFSEILIDLITHLSISENLNRSYDIQALQVIRMFVINILQIHEDYIDIQSNLISRLHFLEKKIDLEYINNPKNKKLRLKTSES